MGVRKIWNTNGGINMGTDSYYINENNEFVIEDYNQQKPFSSFLPAVSGLHGKPMWAYYVNRGQCMATFGVNNKDYSIMEFQPANKAYRLTALQGFRTFYKIKKDNGTFGFYEPFRDLHINSQQKIKQKMRITSYDYKIEDINETLGIKTEILFCTLPDENIPGLVRQVKIYNISDKNIPLEIIDGIPVIIPYYLINQDMKNESNLRQAWMSADIEDNLPFYRIKALPYDTAETVLLDGGNFYLAYNFDGDIIQKPQIITDPSLVFGNVTDFTIPEAFLSEDFLIPEEQVSVGYTPCGFAYKKITLGASEEYTLNTLTGSAPGISQYKKFIKDKIKPGYIEEKIARNMELVESTKRHVFTSSSSKEFDLYMGQTFMDNYLRGGYPVQLGDGKHIMYVYSRKHGDLEREYNFFQVDSTNYSQGNSNYRDVNQNRRNDVYFFPFTENTGIKTFFNLIQLDGYNPLVLEGSRFEAEDKETCRKITEKYFDKDKAGEIIKIYDKAFTPGSLLLAAEQLNAEVKTGTASNFLNDILSCCIKEDCATFKEGYWTDHWTYNTDILVQFINIYPDKVQEIMFNDYSYTYYDNDEFVVPRDKRYVLTENGVRQYNAVQKVPGKTELIRKRAFRPYQVRKENGTGDIYKCSLASKIIVMLLNKAASLDPAGKGLEMEGGKPGWCDALNGLPGIIGSSVNESTEVRRLADLMAGILKEAGTNIRIKLPAEAAEFFRNIFKLLKENVTGMDYWNKSNEAKETYRSMIVYGIDGREEEITKETALEFMEVLIKYMDKGLIKAFNKETGIYDTYFINEAVKYEIIKDKDGNAITNKDNQPFVHITEFTTRAVPAFLEGQVHMMRTYPGISQQLHKMVKKSELYDSSLGMFKVSANIMDETKEIGRQNVFPRGWLENEAVFLHMEYKYFLEMLRSGMYKEFFEYLQKSFVPFMDASVYGRSILENSSFIASSVHPDKRIHGTGYVSRLSGASAEMLSIWSIMVSGKQLFTLDASGSLCMELSPVLPGWMFTKEEKEVTVYTEKGEMQFKQPVNSFVFCLLGSTLVIYHNKNRKDTYSKDAQIIETRLYKQTGEIEIINGGIIPSPYAGKIRNNNYIKIEAVID